MKRKEPKFWDRKDVAAYGKASVRTVAEWMKHGLPYVKINNGMVRFISTDVERWLEKQRVIQK